MLLVYLSSVIHLTKIENFYYDSNITNKKNDICDEQMSFSSFTHTLLLAVSFE